MLNLHLYKNINKVHSSALMYAKLFSRIAQSSLMEEKVTTRYVFMMMLALADRNGDVIGTDVAIARMMNVSVDEFKSATKPLLAPDDDSNSQAEEGRRLVPSENGRGYKIVNYLCYRDMKSEEEKREYMRNYMRERRSKDSVKPVKKCKTLSTDVTHTEAYAYTESDAYKNKEEEPTSKSRGTLEEFKTYAKSIGLPETDGEHLHANMLESGWKRGKQPVKDWQATMRKWKTGGWLPSQKNQQPNRHHNSYNENPQLTIL